MMCVYVGVDVSKTSLDIVFLMPDQSSHWVQVANSQDGITHLLDQLKAFEQSIHLCLEATGRYWQLLATQVDLAGYRVSVVNPRQIKAFRETGSRANKTDRDDAFLIAQFCQLYQPIGWLRPQVSAIQLKDCVRRRFALLKMCQQERNRLQSGICDPFILQSIQRIIAVLQQEIDQITIQIKALIKQQPLVWKAFNLLKSIPGIGDITAATLLAEIGDWQRFDHASQLVAFVGVDPQHFESGTSIKKPTRISKRGNAHLRAALYMPSIVAKSRSTYFAPLIARLEAKGHTPLSIVIVIMRKLLVLAFAILKSARPFDPNYACNLKLTT